MARSWARDPIPRLEELAEAGELTPGAGLPNHAPVLERPTLQLQFGAIPEDEIGIFGSAERVTAESALIAGILEQYGPHLARGGALKPGQEGTPLSSWLLVFRGEEEHVSTRLEIIDSGSIDLQISGRETSVSVRVRQGPPRLNSRWVRVVVTQLHEDFMVPGVIASLLESAGYVAGGEQGFVLKAEHSGEHRGEISAIMPDLGRCGVVVGVVRPPPTDPTLSRLPKTLQDSGGGGTVNIHVSHHTPLVPITPPAGPPTVTIPNPAPPSSPQEVHDPTPAPLDPPQAPHQQRSSSTHGHTHLAAGFQPSPSHLPLPPPPPPHRRLSSSLRQTRTVPAFLHTRQGGTLLSSNCSFIPPPNAPRTSPLPGFLRAVHPAPAQQQIAPSIPLTRALDPILDLGAHIPGDFRGIGRFPSPPRGPVPPSQYIGLSGNGMAGTGRSSRGRFGAIGSRILSNAPAAAHSSLSGVITDHDMGVRSAPPPGFPFPTIPPPPAPPDIHEEGIATEARPMEVDQVIQGTLGDPLAAGPDQGIRGASAEVLRLPPRGSTPFPAASAATRMEIDPLSTLLALPGNPLVESCMAWIEDNEDPARDMTERRQHVRRLIREYPSVYTRHTQDGSNPPQPEVRTALREIGGLLPSEGAEDPPPAITHSRAPSQPPAGPSPPSRQRRRNQKGAHPLHERGDGPAASAGRRSGGPPGPWHASSRLPHSSAPRSRSQLPSSPQSVPPGDSRRRSQ